MSNGEPDPLGPMRVLKIYLSRMYEWRDSDFPVGTLSPLFMDPTNKTTISRYVTNIHQINLNYKTRNELEKHTNKTA